MSKALQVSVHHAKLDCFQLYSHLLEKKWIKKYDESNPKSEDAVFSLFARKLVLSHMQIRILIDILFYDSIEKRIHFLSAAKVVSLHNIVGTTKTDKCIRWSIIISRDATRLLITLHCVTYSWISEILHHQPANKQNNSKLKKLISQSLQLSSIKWKKPWS